MTTPSGSPKILIAGLGNELLADDGVGVHVARAMMCLALEDVQVVEVGVAAIHALDLFEGVDAIIAIDAIEAGGPPGSVYCLDGADAASPSRLASLHDLGVMGALLFLPPESRPAVTLVGVEPARIAYSLELSPPVKEAVPQVVQAVLRLVEELRGPLVPAAEAAA